MTRPILSFRQLLLLGAIVALSLLGFAYLLEHFEKLNPCPLCLLQRYVLWVMVLVMVLGGSLPLKRIAQLGFGFGVILLAMLGALLAGRQVWLQQLPMDQIPPCTAGLSRLLSYHSVPETLKMVLTSSGECGVVDYRLLGLSLAVWSLFAFIGFIVLGIITLNKR